MKKPNVLMRHTSPVIHSVFNHFYTVMEEGYFDLDATEVATTLGVSRRSVYNAITWLMKVNLLKRTTMRTGRGRRSQYFLNWRKPKEEYQAHKARPKTLDDLEAWTQSFIALTPEEQEKMNRRAEQSLRRNCAAPYKGSILKQKTPKGERLRRYTIMHFRAFLERHTALTTSEARMCAQVIGNHLKDKPINYRQELMDKLWKIRQTLHTPTWCWKEPKQTYAWFGWKLKGVA